MAFLLTAITAALRTLMSVIGSTSLKKIMAMSETGVATPSRPSFARSRSYSSNGMLRVRSERPLSISAMRAAGSVTNLNTTVLKAGASPQ